MDTTVVAYFRDQWDHFRGGGGGGTVVTIVEYYGEPEAGGRFGEPSHPANFEIFDKHSYTVWCILEHFSMTSFLSFLSNLQAVPYFLFFYICIVV